MIRILQAILSYLLLVALGIGIIGLIGSFLFWDLSNMNPMNWGEEVRASSLPGLLLIPVLLLNYKHL